MGVNMKEKISLVIEKELWEQFRTFCKNNGCSFSKKVEVLIRNELDHKTRKEKRTEEIMDILATMISEKKKTTKKPEVAPKKKAKKGDVSDLKGLTERYFDKKRERIKG